ncbi:hypothetical protein LguiB_021045 [Lonicera macranthoides]
MTVEDLNSPHGLRLLIQDYPFAVDGLEIWHSSDEVFLGQRDTAEWTTNMEVIKAFGRFGKKLEEIA